MKIIRVKEYRKDGNDCNITVRKCLTQTNEYFKVSTTYEYNGWFGVTYDSEVIDLDCENIEDAIKEFEGEE